MLQRKSAVLISVMEYEKLIAPSLLPTPIPSPLIRADAPLFYRTVHNLKPLGYRLIYLMRGEERETERERGREGAREREGERGKNVKRSSLTSFPHLCY